MIAAAFEHVSHRFCGTWVLAHLQLRIARGSRVLLTGDNGAGKTTLLRLLATALRPSRGTVTIFGMPAHSHAGACRRRLALMTHQHFFYEALSARANLQLVAKLARRPDAGITAVLASAGLAQAAAAPVHTFSAGMKRRLALARLLLLQPDLLLLDEPFVQLDGAGVAFVENFLQEQAGRGVTWVLSTHDPARVGHLCSHHVHLHRDGPGRPGTLRAAEGTP